MSQGPGSLLTNLKSIAITLLAYEGLGSGFSHSLGIQFLSSHLRDILEPQDTGPTHHTLCHGQAVLIKLPMLQPQILFTT